MRTFCAVAISLLVVSSVCAAGTSYVVPTTTLTAQTANNTSAANNFPTQSNGNLGANNVSKVDVHTLLYPGATTKVYAHLMVWFGQSDHMNVGYSSTDPAQVANQINDMISRGIDGVLIDWYGPNNSKDQATQLVMAEAEKHPGFTFAIIIDKGAISEEPCSGCSPQQTLVSQLQYLQSTYFSSPAYMTIQGQPVVTNFDIDLYYTIDWNAANAALSTHPWFLFQNSGGFTHTLSGGSFSWVMPSLTDYGLGYLSNFYDTGMGYPSQATVGATYKGFNDSLAAWGSNRIMNQQCGQTWLQTFGQINSLYNSGKPLSDLQLVTWNDYEEATEIESGIDDCVNVSASVSQNTLNWTIGGQESTIDHYTIYLSNDGENLMSLGDLGVGTFTQNLCAFPIPNGSYKLFVQAVGKPTLANRITGPISYNASCAAAGSPNLSFSASPTSVTVPSGQSVTLNVVATPKSGSFNSAITLSCSGLPDSLACSFSPATITPKSKVATSTLTISAASVVGSNRKGPQRSNSLPIHASWLLPLGVAGLAFAGNVPRKRGVQMLVLAFVLATGMMTVACGGGSSSQAQSTSVNNSTLPGSYSVTISGNSSSAQLATTVNVIVQ